MIHKYIIRETNKRPSKLILAGNKIMYMKIGSIRFIDSMNHVAQSLSMFPSIFGLKEMKKGYFPYLLKKKSSISITLPTWNFRGAILTEMWN